MPSPAAECDGGVQRPAPPPVQTCSSVKLGQDGGDLLVGLGALTANNADIEAADADLGDFFTAPFSEALERSITEPNVIQASEIETILQTYLVQAYGGDLEPEAALAQADEEITAILAEFY